jgi:hypothetical protein
LRALGVQMELRIEQGGEVRTLNNDAEKQHVNSAYHNGNALGNRGKVSTRQRRQLSGGVCLTPTGWDVTFLL